MHAYYSSLKLFYFISLSTLGSITSSHAQEASNWRLNFERHEFQLVEQELSKLVKEYPDSTLLLEYLGLAYHYLGRPDQSLGIWQYILSVDSTHHTSLYRMGLSHFEVSRYEEAIRYWKKLTEVSDNPYYFKLLGKAFFNNEDLLSSFQAYAKAHALNPNDLEAIYQLSSLFFKQKQFIEADSLVLVGLAIDPNNEKLQLLQIETCYSSGYYDHVIYELEIFRQEGRLNNYLRRLLSVCYIQANDGESAVEVLKEIEEPDNNEEMTYYYLHKAYYELNDLVLARHFLEKCLEACIHPNEGKYQALMGNILIETEKYFEAAMRYSSAYGLTKDPQLLYLTGRAYDAAEKFSSAYFSYRQYISAGSEIQDQEALSFATERIKVLAPLIEEK